MGWKINITAIVSAILLFNAGSAFAVQVRREPQAVAAPTQPIIAKTLDNPTAQNDTKNDATAPATPSAGALESIVDKAADKKPVILPKNAPAPPTLVQIDPATQGAESESFLTTVRIFAIRWREVFDIVFVGAITVFTGLLYRISRNQDKLLARSVQAAEDAAHAARQSAQHVEILVVKTEYSAGKRSELELL